MVSVLGGGGVAPPSNSPGDISPSSSFREKEGRMHDLLMPPTWPPMSGPAGGHLCCPGSGVPDQQGRNQGPVLSHMQTLKTTRSPLCGPEWTEELVSDEVSSLKDCLRWERGPAIKGTRRV